jgi:hypothetical protein
LDGGNRTVAITTTDLDNDQKPDFLVGFDGSYSGYLKDLFQHHRLGAAVE